MQIPFAALVLLCAFAVLMVVKCVIDNRVVRNICLRERRPYSISWPLSWYWQGRTCKLDWFAEAREAGCLRQLLMVYAAGILVVAAFILLATYSRNA
jgi:hypothetical protein